MNNHKKIQMVNKLFKFISSLVLIICLFTSCENEVTSFTNNSKEVLKQVSNKSGSEKTSFFPQVDYISDISVCGNSFSAEITLCYHIYLDPAVSVFAHNLSTNVTTYLGNAQQDNSIPFGYRLDVIKGPGGFFNTKDQFLIVVTATDFPYTDPCSSPSYNCDSNSDYVCDGIYYREDIFTSCAITDPGSGPGCC